LQNMQDNKIVVPAEHVESWAESFCASHNKLVQNHVGHKKDKLVQNHVGHKKDKAWTKCPTHARAC
jgi:hypothetical protein